jgi:hypothetical protein
MNLIQVLYIKKGQVLKLFCDDGFFKVFASQCKYYQNNIEWKLSTQVFTILNDIDWHKI